MERLQGNKLTHSEKVATVMYRMSGRNEMYILGMMHDIGYIGGAENHGMNGGELLKRDGYIYWREVYWHGKHKAKYRSRELDLLNFADLTVNSKGEFVGFQKRLDEILYRYGEYSNQFRNAKNLVFELQNRGYNDKDRRLADLRA